MAFPKIIVSLANTLRKLGVLSTRIKN